MKRLRFILLFLGLITICNYAKAQITFGQFPNPFNSNNQPFFAVGLNYSDQLRGELCLNYGELFLFNSGNATSNKLLGAARYGIGSEFTFNLETPVIGPKFYYAESFGVVAGGLQLIRYTDFEQGVTLFRPELGLSYLGNVDLTYGYQFRLSKAANSMTFQHHVISLKYNLTSTPTK